jgi:membrane-bound hydrogenase subunit mbhJ
MKLTKSFNRSLWVYHVNTGSCNGCEIEIVATITPRYDPERFGIKLVGTPRHADVLLVTGPVTHKMADRLKRVYAQPPAPKVVMCIGSCGRPAGSFESYILARPQDQVIRSSLRSDARPALRRFHGVVTAIAKLERLEAEKQ